jgi:hypothetical protein
MMMPEVVLVNTSRGEIVHIPSLVEALGKFPYSFQSIQFALKGRSYIIFTIDFCDLVAPHYSEPVSILLRRSLNAKSLKIAWVTKVFRKQFFVLFLESNLFK